jgi:hypothetical protein
MSACASPDANGFLRVVSQADCTDFVLMTQIEFENLQSGSLQQMQELLSALFTFDPEVFAIVETALILAFLTSHFSGRIVRWLGK